MCKSRHPFAVLALLILAGATAGPLAGQDPPVTWQESWNAFVDQLQAHFDRKEHGEVFERLVIGKVVTWEGKLEKVEKPTPLFGGATGQWFATVDFGARTVRFEGIEARVIPPPIKIRSSDLALWQAVPVGTRVAVQIRLEARNMLGTLFFTDTRIAGEEILSFMAQDGELAATPSTAP